MRVLTQKHRPNPESISDNIRRQPTLPGRQRETSLTGEVPLSSGQPLDATTRRFMESRFGHDFSHVRVYADPLAADAASALSARAFTVNADITFGAGEYAPQSESGRRLLSHELTHVLQQQGRVQITHRADAADPYEQQAERVALAVKDGQAVAPILDPFRPILQRGLPPRPIVQCQTATPAQTPVSPPETAQVLPSADELATRIANCIGIWETNRGKNVPAPKESTLDTVAGVHASMATIEQATMPYAIGVLKTHKELRDKANPPLTMKELNDADARCVAVVNLLNSVATASSKGSKSTDFVKDHQTTISATGLNDADVQTMFAAVTLKGTIDTAHATANAEKTAEAKKTKVKEAIDAIQESDRLGLGESSLKAYINKPVNWGENRAGWQRKAVNAMPDAVGTRIQQVAVSDSGAALAIPTIKTRVNTQLAKKPLPTLEDIVKTVAQQNNPGEKDYGSNVLNNYVRLYS